MNLISSLCHKHSPTPLLLSSLHILISNQSLQQFLYGRHADARFIFHVRKRQRWLRSHSVQYLRVIGCSECNPLHIIPPHILIPLAHKQHVVIHLRGHQFIEIFQERTDVPDVCMGTIARHGAYFKVSLM